MMSCLRRTYNFYCGIWITLIVSPRVARHPQSGLLRIRKKLYKHFQGRLLLSQQLFPELQKTFGVVQWVNIPPVQPYAHSNTATTPMPQMMPIAKETLPFREEIERVLANYIHERAPRELNLNSATKNGLKAAVKRTDHPSIFNEVIKEVKRSLETQGFPNYIKKALENANSARRACAVCIGAFLVSCGVLGLTFSSLGHWNRGWRFLNAIVIVPGFATFYAGNKGMCVVLHGLGHYQIKQWELFEDAEDMKLKDFFGVIAGKKEDQPWVKKYVALSLIRKIFGKEAKVEQPGIQQFHNVEFLKALILGSIFGVLLCLVVYVLAPIGGFY
jgi:hypothetical protein